MRKLINPNDYIGLRFGRLQIISFEGIKDYFHLVRVKCDCGNEKVIRLNSMTRKEYVTKSCGCLNEENTKSRINIDQTSHGQAGTAIYRSWTNMRRRCYEVSNNRYYRYGGRGITVCDEWKDSFDSFFKWSQGKYSKGLQIDRIDNDKNYSPENCKWSTPTEQARNRSTNKIIEYKGEIKTLAEWSLSLSISQATLGSRLLRGWSVEKAFNKPIMSIK